MTPVIILVCPVCSSKHTLNRREAPDVPGNVTSISTACWKCDPADSSRGELWYDKDAKLVGVRRGPMH